MCSEHTACIWTSVSSKDVSTVSVQTCRPRVNCAELLPLKKHNMLIMHTVRRCSAMRFSSVTVEQQLWQHGATFVKQCRPKFLCRWVMINHCDVPASFYTKTECEDCVLHCVLCSAQRLRESKTGRKALHPAAVVSMTLLCQCSFSLLFTSTSSLRPCE